jgi:hypothetical protein
MKLKIILCATVVALSGLVFAQAPDQEEENVRGAFLTSRPKDKPPQNSATPRQSRRRPRPTGTSSGTTASASVKVTTTSGPTTPAASNDGSKTNAVTKSGQRLGLGLTLFTRDVNGLSVRVDPSHEFHRGDRVRVLLETNSDGYLYIFNTTNNGQPVMIYPSPELDEAGNFIRSHVPFEIPSSAAMEERLRWFTFDENAGTERLYFVFSRDPLPGVPIEDDLIAYCRENGKACPWKPSAELWVMVQKDVNAPLKTDKSQKYGRPQTVVEKDATTRGIGLSQQDPEPSVIMMSVASSGNTLVTALDLVHR